MQPVTNRVTNQSASSHIPVLVKEVLEYLQPQPGKFFIDGTFGGGGHARAILEKVGAEGKLLVIDWEEAAILKNCNGFGKNHPEMVCVNDNYARLPDILQQRHLPKADGLLLDLGFSSDQIEASGKGFSFKRDEVLTMTYSEESIPVYKLLAEISEEELARIIKEFGEERYARPIARAIIEYRKNRKSIMTSKELADIIVSSVPKSYERGRIHPATRTFQALRIYANHELENLKTILEHLSTILKPGGRIVIISFHSLEDRVVKRYFRDLAKAGKATILTKKPVVASEREIQANPRARSAKLRAITIHEPSNQ